MSYQGPDGPLQSSDTVMIWPYHSMVVWPHHQSPDVPLGSGCPTVVQMPLCDPSMLSPSISAVQSCSGHHNPAFQL